MAKEQYSSFRTRQNNLKAKKFGEIPIYSQSEKVFRPLKKVFQVMSIPLQSGKLF